MNSTKPTNSTRPIRVLQLGSPTGLYGAERWILALIKHLDPEKVQSIVGVIKDDPTQDAPLCQEAAKLGFKTIFFKVHGKASFSAIKQIKHFIKNNQIDILHTHFYKTDLIGFLATRGTDCKIISTPHGWTQAPDIKLRIYEIIDRAIFPLLDAVVPLAEKMMTPLQRIPGLKKKLHLIHNAVDLSEIMSESGIADELIPLKKQGCFIVGYIGRLVRGKGLDILFKALDLLQDINWKLVVIGEGEEKINLENQARQLGIKKNIYFYGFRSDRIRFLKGFDVFVLPSRSEGTPRCVMEAMAAKIPVIASDIPGCRNLITDNVTGRLFTLDSSKELAEKINFFASSIQFREKITQNGFMYILQNYSAKRMATGYEDVYTNMTEIKFCSPPEMTTGEGSGNFAQ